MIPFTASWMSDVMLSTAPPHGYKPRTGSSTIPVKSSVVICSLLSSLQRAQQWDHAKTSLALWHVLKFRPLSASPRAMHSGNLDTCVDKCVAYTGPKCMAAAAAHVQYRGDSLHSAQVKTRWRAFLEGYVRLHVKSTG